MKFPDNVVADITLTSTHGGPIHSFNRASEYIVSIYTVKQGQGGCGHVHENCRIFYR